MTQSGGMGERVILPDSAAQLTYMMSRVIEEGTGRRARLEGREAAGKTGTTQAARDAWFLALPPITWPGGSGWAMTTTRPP